MGIGRHKTNEESPGVTLAIPGLDPDFDDLGRPRSSD